MRQSRGFVWGLACALVAGIACAQDQEPPKGLSGYLADVSAGAVSAGTLVGLSQSAISQIQTSQDLIAAIKPFASSSSKAGFGLAITPARTAIMPVVSAREYYNSAFARVLGSVTLSHAENTAEIAAVSYRKSGFSIDTYYYLDPSDDPVVAAYDAFNNCPLRRAADLADSQARIKRRAARRALDAAKTPEDKERAQDELDEAEAAIKQAKIDGEASHRKCVDQKLKTTKWNASRLSVSFGAAWIKPDDNSSSRQSLGRSGTFGGIVKTGDQGATYLSFRRTWREVDLTTLGATPQFKSSNLAAARFTYGSKQDDGNWKALLEASNAKKNDVTVSNRVFKYAVGLDAKLRKGVWLEFRLGKNRTLDGTASQTTSLLSFNFAPTTSLFPD